MSPSSVGWKHLQVEASHTYDNLSSSSLAPVVGTFVVQGSFPGVFTLNQPLPTGTGGAGVFTIMFTSGPLSDGVGFTSNQRRAKCECSPRALLPSPPGFRKSDGLRCLLGGRQHRSGSPRQR